VPDSGSIPSVSCGEGTKDEDHVRSCDPSLECEPEPRLDGPDENARFTPPIISSSCTALATITHNNKYLAP
jgi:hypothetical protein